MHPEGFYNKSFVANNILWQENWTACGVSKTTFSYPFVNCQV